MVLERHPELMTSGVGLIAGIAREQLRSGVLPLMILIPSFPFRSGVETAIQPSTSHDAIRFNHKQLQTCTPNQAVRPMLPEQRKRTMVALVTEHDGRSVAELAEKLGVSKATVRRDLQTLEDQSLIERSHGGAVPIGTVGREQPYRQREVSQLDEKVAIAERAVSGIERDEVVFFDSGTTTLEVAKRAPEPIVAVTNSPVIALELDGEKTDIKLTGGTLRDRSRALVGPSAESFMERMSFDRLVLGANAINEDGLMTPDEDEARIKSLMVENAAHVIAVVDATKFGERSFIRFADLAEIDQLVTDEKPPKAVRKACGDADVSVAVVTV